MYTMKVMEMIGEKKRGKWGRKGGRRDLNNRSTFLLFRAGDPRNLAYRLSRFGLSRLARINSGRGTEWQVRALRGYAT